MSSLSTEMIAATNVAEAAAVAAVDVIPLGLALGFEVVVVVVDAVVAVVVAAYSDVDTSSS